MSGFFIIKLLNVGNLTDEDFLVVEKQGNLKKLIDSFEIEKEISIQNRIFDGAAAYLLQELFVKATSKFPWSDHYGNSAMALLGFICMLNIDSEPASYTVEWTGSLPFDTGYIHDVANSVNTNNTNGAAKRFIEDQMFDYEVISSDIREEISFRNAFMYTTDQCNGSNIRSIGVFGNATDADALFSPWPNYMDVERSARVRLKENGSPITFDKTNNQMLFVQYELKIVNM